MCTALLNTRQKIYTTTDPGSKLNNWRAESLREESLNFVCRRFESGWQYKQETDAAHLSQLQRARGDSQICCSHVREPIMLYTNSIWSDKGLSNNIRHTPRWFNGSMFIRNALDYILRQSVDPISHKCLATGHRYGQQSRSRLCWWHSSCSWAIIISTGTPLVSGGSSSKSQSHTKCKKDGGHDC